MQTHVTPLGVSLQYHLDPKEKCLLVVLPDNTGKRKVVSDLNQWKKVFRKAYRGSGTSVFARFKAGVAATQALLRTALNRIGETIVKLQKAIAHRHRQELKQASRNQFSSGSRQPASQHARNPRRPSKKRKKPIYQTQQSLPRHDCAV